MAQFCIALRRPSCWVVAVPLPTLPAHESLPASRHLLLRRRLLLLLQSISPPPLFFLVPFSYLTFFSPAFSSFFPCLYSSHYITTSSSSSFSSSSSSSSSSSFSSSFSSLLPQLLMKTKRTTPRRGLPNYRLTSATYNRGILNFTTRPFVELFLPNIHKLNTILLLQLFLRRGETAIVVLCFLKSFIASLLRIKRLQQNLLAHYIETSLVFILQ